MLYARKHSTTGSWLFQVNQKSRQVVDAWIRQYIIDDDPYETEAWQAALMQTQNVYWQHVKMAFCLALNSRVLHLQQLILIWCLMLKSRIAPHSQKAM